MCRGKSGFPVLPTILLADALALAVFGRLFVCAAIRWLPEFSLVLRWVCNLAGRCRKEINMEGRVYGYARVSAKDQNLDRQMIALSEFPVEKRYIFADKASGKDFKRPAYRKLVSRIKPGDVVVIKSIDRLGRNYEEILNEWRIITKDKKAAIVVLDMPLLDTRVQAGDVTGMFLADVVLQLLSYVAQVERENTHRRQAEGIAAAKARGTRFGRPAIRRPGIYGSVKKAYLSHQINRREAAGRLKVSVSTFDRWLKADKG